MLKIGLIKRAASGLILLVLLQACAGTPELSPAASPRKAVFSQQDYDAALRLMKQKKYRNAVSMLEKIIRNDDQRAGPYINLGISYRELGKLREAKRALRAASERNQESAVALNELGIVYRKMGEFSNARMAYRQSISKESDYDKAYLNLGILCDIYLEDLSCAIKNYKKYQSVSKTEDKKVALWIVDLKRRKGK